MATTTTVVTDWNVDIGDIVMAPRGQDVHGVATVTAMCSNAPSCLVRFEDGREAFCDFEQLAWVTPRNVTGGQQEHSRIELPNGKSVKSINFTLKEEKPDDAEGSVGDSAMATGASSGVGAGQQQQEEEDRNGPEVTDKKEDKLAVIPYKKIDTIFAEFSKSPEKFPVPLERIMDVLGKRKDKVLDIVDRVAQDGFLCTQGTFLVLPLCTPRVFPDFGEYS